jgi:hypothetical protein
MSEVKTPETTSPESVETLSHTVNTNSAIQFIASMLQKPTTTIEDVATTAAALGLRLEFKISVAGNEDDSSMDDLSQSDDE